MYLWVEIVLLQDPNAAHTLLLHKGLPARTLELKRSSSCRCASGCLGLCSRCGPGCCCCCGAAGSRHCQHGSNDITVAGH